MNTDYGKLTGKISDIELSHCHGKNTFYKFNLNSARKSGIVDAVPCVMNTCHLRKIDITKLDNKVKVYGEFKSRNVDDGEKRKLELYFKVIDIEQMEGEDIEDINHIFLHGTLCKEPQYRVTPMGREITDLLIAVNFGNPRMRSSYIPLICWGETARIGKDILTIGSIISIEGRIQSREYHKLVDGIREDKVAYEVSVSKLFIVNSDGEFENIMTGALLENKQVDTVK